MVAAGALSALAAGIGGCTHRIALRDGLREHHPFETTAEDELGLGELQVFTSERIMLRRRLRSGEREVARGKIVSRKGKLVEELVVWSSTPGVIVDAGEDWLDVSFERGTAMRFVRVDRNRTDAEPEDALYRLGYEVDVKGKPAVDFHGKRWRPVDRSTHAYLVIRREAHGRFKWRRTRLRGMRVGETAQR